MARKLKIKKKKGLKIVKKIGKQESQPQKQYADLRSVMDYTQTFRLIYSGVENEQYFNLLYDMGVRNFLMSYHYITEKHINMERYKGKNVKFLIDSGAHTYQNDLKYQDYGLDYWENHLKKYLNWAKKNREYIYAIVSFDFENLVDPEIVTEWYNKYFEPFMLETGIPVCFVWHQNSQMSWEQYCQRYPYVGFSSVNTEGESIDLQEYIAKLKIAEKYDAVVHGFGMTRTSILTKVPFYTSDSTTWLVGLQYGEVNFWTGTKMTRLKKDKWKGEMLKQLVAKGFDEERLLNEDTSEMIKVNVHAFIEAEEYIQHRLKARMYWQKAKAVVQSIDDIIFPSQEEIMYKENISYETLQDYAKKMNINHELEYQDLFDIVQDATMYLHWDDEAYAELQEEIYNEDCMKDNHDFWINQIRTTAEERLEDLQKFYTECLEGKDNTLLYHGTNFNRKAQERDSYLEDEEVEYIEVSQEEIEYRLANSGLLTSPTENEIAPEVSELDDEIFSNLDIIPVRDEKGRFLKGQQAVRKPKKLYSDKFPKMFCDTCYASQTCPEYKEGMVCAFKKIFQKYDTRKQEDVMDAMHSMAELNLSRLQRASMFEILDGGTISSDVSNLIDQNMRLLSQMQEMNRYNPEVVKQTRVIKADGSASVTTQVNAGAGGGILEKLFSDFNNADTQEVEEDKDIMAEVEEMKEEDKRNAVEVEIIEEKENGQVE